MIIAQISDTHILLDMAQSERRIGDFVSTIKDINALDPAPDVIIHTGDIVHNGRPDEYAKAAAILENASAPVFVMAGNKDNRENLCRAFSATGYLDGNSEFIQYAIDDFPVRLIMLDTVSLHSNRGDFCAARVGQLQALTKRAASKPVVVFTHHPPFAANQCPEPFQFETREGMARIRNSLYEVENLAAIFCGHVHRFDSGKVGKINALAMPSIATELRKGDYPPGVYKRPVYQLHHVDRQGGLTTETRIVGL